MRQKKVRDYYTTPYAGAWSNSQNGQSPDEAELLVLCKSESLVFLSRIRTLAEFERDIIRGRTQAGLSAACARGRFGGRPRGLPKAAEATACAAETLYRERKLSVMQISKKLNISKSTLYKYLRHRNVEISNYEKAICEQPTKQGNRMKCI